MSAHQGIILQVRYDFIKVLFALLDLRLEFLSLLYEFLNTVLAQFLLERRYTSLPFFVQQFKDLSKNIVDHLDAKLKALVTQFDRPLL